MSNHEIIVITIFGTIAALVVIAIFISICRWAIKISDAVFYVHSCDIKNLKYDLELFRSFKYDTSDRLDYLEKNAKKRKGE